MANNHSIPERTLAQVADETDTLNVIGGADGRESAYEPIVVRITDHADNDGAEEDDQDKMAIFESSRHGEPWLKEDNCVTRKTHQGGLGTGVTLTAVVSNGEITSVTVGGTQVGRYSQTATVTTTESTSALLNLVVDKAGIVVSCDVIEGGSGYTTPTLAVVQTTPTDVTCLYVDFDYSTFE